jgi:hypothetical protein
VATAHLRASIRQQYCVLPREGRRRRPRRARGRASGSLQRQKRGAGRPWDARRMSELAVNSSLSHGPALTCHTANLRAHDAPPWCQTNASLLTPKRNRRPPHRPPNGAFENRDAPDITVVVRVQAGSTAAALVGEGIREKYSSSLATKGGGLRGEAGGGLARVPLAPSSVLRRLLLTSVKHGVRHLTVEPGELGEGAGSGEVH